KNLILAAEDLKNSQSKVNALVIAGDITEDCLENEWEYVYNDISNVGVENYILATGNHDIRNSSYSTSLKRFTENANKLNASVGSSISIDKMNYSCTVNGYKFIVLGSDKKEFEEAYISNAQLKWLDSQLKASAKDGKPVFVIAHQSLKYTHGLPNTWGGGTNEASGNIGAQSDDIKDILNRYQNVIFISGHLHTGFGKYSYEKIGNFHSVNLPSIGIDNEDTDYSKASLGYMVEVYDDSVIFRARDFASGCYVEKYDINIKLSKIKSVTLSKTSFTYDGKTKTPTVKLTDLNGKAVPSKYYTVTYPKSRKNIGKYSVKIKFKGKYSSYPQLVAVFDIAPKGTDLTSLKADKKGFTASWKKQSTKTSGYQLEYSTSSKLADSETVTVSSSNASSKAVKKLQSKKKYYVRVRTYKNVKVGRDTVKVYSSWSKAKTIKTK
ncbi:MAG: metallophosphoesterase, partial [Eubacterium sp.]